MPETCDHRQKDGHEVVAEGGGDENNDCKSDADQRP